MNNILTTTQTDSASGKSLGIQAAEDTPILSLKLNLDRAASLPNCSTHSPRLQWNKDSSWNRVLLSVLCLTSFLDIQLLQSLAFWLRTPIDRTVGTIFLYSREFCCVTLPWGSLSHPVAQFYIGGIPRKSSSLSSHHTVPPQTKPGFLTWLQKGHKKFPLRCKRMQKTEGF